MRDFKTLKVWQQSHKFTLEIYRTTATFPKDELFALVSQMRRSSSSIPTNIAEGSGRRTNEDYAHFLQMAFGSACEIEYQILLSADLRYISRDKEIELNSYVVDIKRMLSAFMSKLRE